jgi:hypothetical protein
MKVNIKHFTWLPSDVTKIVNNWGHSKTLRARSHIVNKTKKLILDLDKQSRDCISNWESEFET